MGILGTRSYIGRHFYAACGHGFDRAEFIDCRDGAWRCCDFGRYDSLLCPLGIAHVSADPSMEPRYYAVNRDLPVAIAEKARRDGARHFVFLSSMIVYGNDLPVGREFVITAGTGASPANFYGKSKLEAERLLLAMDGGGFTVSVLRLPMVYGPECRGNFPLLLAAARRLPVFPSLENRRSMIYIDNLCEYLRLVIERRPGGVLFPQNAEYASTVDIIRTAAEYFGHGMLFTRAFNPAISLLGRRLGVVNKVFGTKVYDFSMSPGREEYNVVGFEDSVRACARAYSIKR